MKNTMRKKIASLKAILAGCKSLLIILQDNPDPDAIASAVALRKIANTLGDIQCSFTYGGTIGRGENRALVSYLDLNFRSPVNLDFYGFDGIAMLDTQPGTGNNCLPDTVEPDIVIDHHPCRKNTRQCRFTDIRRRYGSTSTILTEYLRGLAIVPETPLATALLYGLRSDTQDLGRDTTQADMDALFWLYGYANKRMLSQIQRGKVERDYYQMLSTALKNARVYGHAVITYLGQLKNPDMIGETADLLLRDDVIEWVLCYGFYDGKMLLSLRCEAEQPAADKVIRSLVHRKGTGGGHSSYAGGQIPIGSLTPGELHTMTKAVERAFLRKTAPGFSLRNAQKLIT